MRNPFGWFLRFLKAAWPQPSFWRPMREFDPEKPAFLHDRLNEEIITWDAADVRHWRDYAKPHTEGVIAWDGLLIDGWRPYR